VAGGSHYLTMEDGDVLAKLEALAIVLTSGQDSFRNRLICWIGRA
jgi:hypothetical protein